MITEREAAIISAYTGVLLGEFTAMHGYVEEILERPVFTHEMGNPDVMKEIKRKAKPDFIRLEVEDSSTGEPHE